MPESLVLYHTDGCHLCELAFELLLPLGLSVARVDICDDETLAVRYGTRIPVLRQADGRELNWPFDQQAVKKFLGDNFEFGSN
ncbi:thioredoxin family protein [Shewanella sp. NFH-SH190041]|uniref:glutaredoxin family protein n=1 Tax=Shewanella sp. NFH-SH190041 TaxID=2950245 RepID=UPI0021C471EC|nr:glutaredoxin family protein [Shewanella sp. NFH-SH190041]BDM64894.1 thioredoxin family protein [Shewanella sp. NFH-SH190041]